MTAETYQVVHGQRIAFVSPGIQRTSASGAAYYMFKQLHECGEPLLDLQSSRPTPSAARRIAWRIYRGLTGRSVRWRSTRQYCRLAAINLSRRIEDFQPALIFGALVTWDLALLETSIPIVHCTDSTFPLAAGLPAHTTTANLSKAAVATAMELEGRIVRRAALNLVATNWVAESLVRDHRVPANRIRVVPWGGNVDPDEP